MADRPVVRSCAEMIALYGTAADSSGEGPEIMLGTSQVRELNLLIQCIGRDPLEDMPIKGPIPGPDKFDLAALPDDDVLVDRTKASYIRNTIQEEFQIWRQSLYQLYLDNKRMLVIKE